jgi:hypothetical protein
MNRSHAQLWRELELLGTPPPGQYRVLPTSVEAGSGTILYALDPGGRFHVFIPVAERTPFHADTRSAGVHLERRKLQDTRHQPAFLDLACQKVHLRDVFVHLAEDVLNEIAQEPHKPEAVCKRVMSRWRELLDREAPGVMSQEALLGLYGELWILRRIVRINADALRSWTGPLGAVHDFRSQGGALEIKTTLAREGWRFEIHGVLQLAAIDGIPLYFAALSVDSAAPHGESVPEVVDAIVDAGVDTLELFTKLSRLGYDARDSAYYRDTKYSVQEMRFFLVDAEFPRIVPEVFVSGALPERVERLRYTVDLSGLSASALGSEAASSVISAIAGGA